MELAQSAGAVEYTDSISTSGQRGKTHQGVRPTNENDIKWLHGELPVLL